MHLYRAGKNMDARLFGIFIWGEALRRKTGRNSILRHLQAETIKSIPSSRFPIASVFFSRLILQDASYFFIKVFSFFKFKKSRCLLVFGRKSESSLFAFY